MPGPLSADAVGSPAGTVPQPYSHRLMEQEPVVAAGGWARIVDSSNFPAASTVAAALVEVEPGAVRELHWHPNADEWQYYISGQGRMTVFASSGKARTFDYQGGDVGYVPFAMGHYVENTGDEPLRFLEMFRSDRFADVSLAQWMALTPPKLVQAHLNLDADTVGGLSKEKAVIVRAGGELASLPVWPDGTVGVLTTIVDELPHTIPVTAPLRAGERRILFSLKRDRASLARLRAHPEVALAILAADDEVFTARGRARVIEEAMARAPEFAAVALDVEAIDDHRQRNVTVDQGVTVHWSGDGGRAMREHVAALREIAERLS
jgi:oxalate decarboxylase